MTFYEILGVAEYASNSEIKKAYRRRARKVHPDLGGSNDEMARLAKAYKTLVDPDKRAFYDETGHEEPDDPIDVQARSMLVHSFMQIIDENEDGNVVENMKLHWHNECHRWDTLMEQQHAKIKRYEDEMQRIVFQDKDGGENIMASALLTKIAEAKEIIRKNGATLNAMRRVLAMLEAYNYKQKPPRKKAETPGYFYTTTGPSYR